MAASNFHWRGLTGYSRRTPSRVVITDTVWAMPTGDDRPSQSNTYRAVTFAFGVVFTVVAFIILVLSEVSLGSVTAAVLVGGLGVDAIVSALRNKQSLMARIGPLP